MGESPVLWRLSKPFTRLVKVIIKLILRSAKLVIASSDTLAAFCEGKLPHRFHAVVPSEQNNSTIYLHTIS